MSWLTQASVGPYYASEVRDEIEAMLPSNGWVLVDDWVLPATGWQNTDGTGSSTNSLAAATQRVWQNPAANNGAGIDFFVALTVTDIAHATASLRGNILSMGISEQYDTVTHKATKSAPMTSSTTFTLNPDWTHPGPALGFGEGTAAGRPSHTGMNMGESTSPYAITVTNDFIAVSKGLQHGWVGRAIPIGTPMSGDTLLFVAGGTSSTTTPFSTGVRTTRIPNTVGTPSYSNFDGSPGKYYGLADVSSQDVVASLPRGSELFFTDNRHFNAVRGLVDGVVALPVDGTIGDTLTMTIRGVTRTFHRGPHPTSRLWLEKK